MLAMNPNTLLAILQLFSVCFWHLSSMVMMISGSIVVDLLSTALDWKFYSCFHVVLSDVQHKTFGIYTWNISYMSYYSKASECRSVRLLRDKEFLNTQLK